MPSKRVGQAELYQPLAVIPVYDHADAIATVVAGIAAAGLPCLLVDDGSGARCAKELDRLAVEDGHFLLRLEHNQGKGAAMLAGFGWAMQHGYTHVLQMDADGQHDIHDVPRFIQLSKQQPAAMICGIPIYDASVPKHRLYARYLTHIWVWINTLSLELKDSMCGFRVYPLAGVQVILESEYVGRRMDFDTDILVHWYWRRFDVRQQPTRVIYPIDGVSHFDVWRDNVRISAMHARLLLGLIKRLARRVWSRQDHLGS